MKITNRDQEKLFDVMWGVDHPKAQFRLGQRVVKVACDNDGDVHPIGAEAQIIGSIYCSIGTAYLAMFDGDNGAVTFILERKLKGVSHERRTEA